MDGVFRACVVDGEVVAAVGAQRLAGDGADVGGAEGAAVEVAAAVGENLAVGYFDG